MAFALYPSILFAVALLVTVAYFLMGGLPLLSLQHDTALDARFIRGFFRLYTQAALVTALGAALSLALWGRAGLALGAVGLALSVLALRQRLLPALAQLGGQIQAADGGAIQRFRRVHGVALLVNLLQLVAVVWGLTQLSL